MKKVSLVLLASLPLISYARQLPCVINLDIDTVKARKAYLVYKIGEEHHVDSPVIKNGKATFRVSVPYPVHAQISLDNKGYGYVNGNRPDLLRFYMEKGTISIKTKNRLVDAVITG